jgi:predicted MFS family arabinose efflux permease
MTLLLRIFPAYAAGYFLSYLLRNANAVIAPELMRELGLSPAELGLLTSAYLLGFGAFQLPLGILLDRYGPRRVNAGLLLVSAAGSALFGLGHGLPQLAFARAAIGIGASACLMAAFKAFSLWFPVDRLPSLNAAVMVAGSLGALAATTPLSMAVPLLGWRGVFLLLGGLSLATALGVLTTPERTTTRTGETLGQQLAALRGIGRSRVFWRYAPPTALFIGGFLALQGLWAVPWLMHAGGRTRDEAALHLLLTTVAMALGFLLVALFIGALQRRGVRPEQVLVAGMAVGLVVMLGMVLGVGQSHLLWFVLGLSFSAANLVYALLTSRFPPELAGRASTALNLGTFSGAFLVQWGYGVALEALTGRGWTPADAHRAVLGALLLLQAASFVWFLRGGRDRGAVRRTAG